MNRDQRLWFAGVIDAVHYFEVTREEGPHGKRYAALTLRVGPVSEGTAKRMIAFLGNGWVRKQRYFELSGRAAVRGLLEEVWGFISPDTRTAANKAPLLHKANSKRCSGMPGLL